MKLFHFFHAICILTFLSTAQAQIKLSIKGSDTLGVKMVPQLAEVYNTIGNSLDFEISAEGSSSAFSAILDGSAEIGMASRKVKPAEIEQFKDAAYDLIAVVVHEDNPVDNLSTEQVKKIFTGEITNWSEVGGDSANINVYTRNETSGTYKTFQKLAMEKLDYGSRCQKQAGSSIIYETVTKNVNGIAYRGLAYANIGQTKPVSINGILPSLKTKKTYPYSRKLYYYTTGEPTAEAKKFIHWATTSEIAAKVITKTGFHCP